jgi:hypothetical protein
MDHQVIGIHEGEQTGLPGSRFLVKIDLIVLEVQSPRH